MEYLLIIQTSIDLTRENKSIIEINMLGLCTHLSEVSFVVLRPY